MREENETPNYFKAWYPDFKGSDRIYTLPNGKKIKLVLESVAPRYPMDLSNDEIFNNPVPEFSEPPKNPMDIKPEDEFAPSDSYVQGYHLKEAYQLCKAYYRATNYPDDVAKFKCEGFLDGHTRYYGANIQNLEREQGTVEKHGFAVDSLLGEGPNGSQTLGLVRYPIDINLKWVPVKETESAFGSAHTPKAPGNTEYAVEGGKWTFRSWDKESITPTFGSDNVFTGTWTFTPKKQTTTPPPSTTKPQLPHADKISHDVLAHTGTSAGILAGLATLAILAGYGVIRRRTQRNS